MNNKRKKQFKLSTNKKSFAANFTPDEKLIQARSKNDFHNNELDNSGKMNERIYEDPGETLQSFENSTICQNVTLKHIPKDCKRFMKEQKRLLTRKYEELVLTLMDRCEEDNNEINSLRLLIEKLRAKLKRFNDSNQLFSQHNSKLKNQLCSMLRYIDECKHCIVDLEERNCLLESKISPKNDLIDGDNNIKLTTVCMDCSKREIELKQYEMKCNKHYREITALKDIVYNLNLQLSQYREALKKEDNIKQTVNHDDICQVKFNDMTDKSTSVDEMGLPKVEFNAEIMASLINTYKEHLQDKDNIVAELEQRLEGTERTSRRLQVDRQALADELTERDRDIAELREHARDARREKDRLQYELIEWKERAERSEMKLKEVFDTYEDKVAIMSRDYETVHKEYYSVKSKLTAAENRIVLLENSLRSSQQCTRTVPLELFERKIEEFNRISEDVRRKHEMELDQMSQVLDRCRHEYKELSERHQQLEDDYQRVRAEHKAALKDVKMYRKAALSFSYRTRGNMQRSKRYGSNKVVHSVSLTPNVREALNKCQGIKEQIQNVKECSYRSLAEVERRIRERESLLTNQRQRYLTDINCMRSAVEHKEHVIRELTDRVADLEAVGEIGALVKNPEHENEPDKVPQAQMSRVPGGYFHTRGCD